jgi:hypothetical protein
LGTGIAVDCRAVPEARASIFIDRYRLCLVPPKMHYTKRRFPVTSNLLYIHGVLNVDEIKN